MATYTKFDQNNAFEYSKNRLKLLQITWLHNNYPHIASWLDVKITQANPNIDYYYPEEFANHAIKVSATLNKRGCENINCNNSNMERNCTFDDKPQMYRIGQEDKFDVACTPACYHLRKTAEFNEEGIMATQSLQTHWSEHKQVCALVPSINTWMEKPRFRSDELYESRLNNLAVGFNRKINPEAKHGLLGYEYGYNEYYCDTYGKTYDKENETCYATAGERILHSIVGESLTNMTVAGIRRVLTDTTMPEPEFDTPIPPLDKRYELENWKNDINSNFVIPPYDITISDLRSNMQYRNAFAVDIDEDGTRRTMNDSDILADLYDTKVPKKFAFTSRQMSDEDSDSGDGSGGGGVDRRIYVEEDLNIHDVDRYHRYATLKDKVLPAHRRRALEELNALKRQRPKHKPRAKDSSGGGRGGADDGYDGGVDDDSSATDDDYHDNDPQSSIRTKRATKSKATAQPKDLEAQAKEMLQRFMDTISRIMGGLIEAVQRTEFWEDLLLNQTITVVLKRIPLLMNDITSKFLPLLLQSLTRLGENVLEKTLFATLDVSLTKVALDVVIKSVSTTVVALCKILAQVSSVVGTILGIATLIDLILTLWDPLGFTNYFDKSVMENLMQNGELALRRSAALPSTSMSFDLIVLLLIPKHDQIVLGVTTLYDTYQYLSSLTVNSDGSVIDHGTPFDINVINVGRDSTYITAQKHVTTPKQLEIYEEEHKMRMEYFGKSKWYLYAIFAVSMVFMFLEMWVPTVIGCLVIIIVLFLVYLNSVINVPKIIDDSKIHLNIEKSQSDKKKLFKIF